MTGVFLLFYSVLAFSQVCPDDVVEGRYTTKYVCEQSGAIKEISVFFNKTQTLRNFKRFEEGQLVLEETYNIDHEKKSETYYSYPDENHFIEKRYHFPLEGERELYTQTLRQGDPEGESQLLKEWVFKDLATEEVRYLNVYDGERVISREVQQGDVCGEILIFHYFSDDPQEAKLSGFESWNCGQNLQNYVFAHAQGVDLDQLLQEQSLDASEKERRLQILKDSQRRRFMVIDSGFDTNHPDLTYKFLKNSQEILDGLDNDQNGIVDDLVGAYYEKDTGWIGNINERVSLDKDSKIPQPFSHGTHVASLALKGIESFSLYPVAGDFTSPLVLDWARENIEQNKIEFVNMSFSFGHSYKSVLDPGTFRSVKALIAENPEVLFVVAAGNDSSNLDMNYHSKQFPASYTYDNELVVGALDTASFEEKDAPSYQGAYFSNVGVKTVDVFAPGTKVLGANLGGVHLPVSGTSMATPHVLNSALKLAEAFPELSPLEIKSLLFYSVYVPNLQKPLPCASGGMIFLRRALRAAELLVQDPKLSPKEAALQVRKEPQFILLGERLDEAYFQGLEELWSKRL